MLISAILVAVCGYVLGSFPTGYLIGRVAGTDIRTQGSGNIGATNVLRTIGRKHGYTVFLVDALKGFAAVWSGLWLTRHLEPNTAMADWFSAADAGTFTAVNVDEDVQ